MEAPDDSKLAGRLQMVYLRVPLYPQETRNTCADACARMCIAYYLSKGVSSKICQDIPSEQTLFTEYGQGCITPIVSGLRDYNGIDFSCMDIDSLPYFRKTIEKSLRSGHPVVLDVKSDTTSLLGYSTAGHYVVVTGLEYSEGLLKLVINDPFHKDGFGIGQTVLLNLSDVYDAVQYMVCEHSVQEA